MNLCTSPITGSGANIEVKDEYGDSPLKLSIRMGHYEIVDYLLKNDADVNAENDEGQSVLMEAVLQGNQQIVNLLINKDAIIDKKNNKNETALFIASKMGFDSIVNVLLKYGANINEVNGDKGFTSLMVSVFNGHMETVKTLIANGADLTGMFH